MLKTYTKAEMLAYWKRRLGLRLSPRVVGIEDVTELDNKLLDDIDLWYEDLLQTAPPDKVPTADFADSAVAHYIDENCVEVILPEEGVRPVAVKMQEWKFEETEYDTPYSETAQMQRNRLTCATPTAPVAIRRRDRLDLYGLIPPKSLDAQPPLDRLIMVVHPTDDTYMLDPSLLRKSRLMIY